MTVAVCIRCGAMKHGALTSCSQCQFEPQENEDKAKAMVLTDHVLKPEELHDISNRIKSGQLVNYPEDMLKQITKTFEENPNLGKFPTSFKIVFLAVFLGIIAVVIWFLMGNT